jgi:DNA-binding transcriptional LysR family regulator
VHNNEEMLVHVALGHGVCIAAATIADHHRADVVFRPIADLPPLPLLLLTAPGPRRPDVGAFCELGAAVAAELTARRPGSPTTG